MLQHVPQVNHPRAVRFLATTTQYAILVYWGIAGCQPLATTNGAQQQLPLLAPASSSPPRTATSPLAIAAAAPTQPFPPEVGPPDVEELLVSSDAERREQRDLRIYPLGSVAALCDGPTILAIADGESLQTVEIPSPLEVVTKADPDRPAPESVLQWNDVAYFGEWPNDLWAVAKKAGFTGYHSATALVHWSGSDWQMVFDDPDLLFAGLTPQRHALVLRSFFQDCDATVAMMASMPGCPKGIGDFRAFHADGKLATDIPKLPASLRPADWYTRPEVAVSSSGEVFLFRAAGDELPNKTQHLLVHFSRGQSKGTVSWVGDARDGFPGTLRVQTTGVAHVASTGSGLGHRLEGNSLKAWRLPSATLDVFADEVLWAATRDGSLFCSRNGDEWQEVHLGLPTGKARVQIQNVWRGATTTLYVVVSLEQARRIYRVRNASECRASPQ